jgi:hypothetical protein
MTEDLKLAREAVERDARNAGKMMRGSGVPCEVVTYDEAPSRLDAETAVSLTIGIRGDLTKREALRAAQVWMNIRANSPNSPIYVHFLGYDDDPRELHEFPEVMRYLRWWARAAGLGDFNTAFAAVRDPLRFPALLALSAVSGVFGDDLPEEFQVVLPPPQSRQ